MAEIPNADADPIARNWFSIIKIKTEPELQKWFEAQGLDFEAFKLSQSFQGWQTYQRENPRPEDRSLPSYKHSEGGGEAMTNGARTK